jgi:hypothetical protein
VDHVAGPDLRLGDEAAVDVGAVGRAEVAQHPARVVVAQLGVAARDGVVAEHDLAGARAADDDVRADEVRQRARREPGQQAREQRARGRGREIRGQTPQLLAAVALERLVEPVGEGVGPEPARQVAASQLDDRLLAGVVRRSHGRVSLLRRSGLRNETPCGIAQTSPTRYLAPQPTGRFGG